MLFGGFAPKSSLFTDGMWWEVRDTQTKQTWPGYDNHCMESNGGLLFLALQYIEMFYNKKF